MWSGVGDATCCHYWHEAGEHKEAISQQRMRALLAHASQPVLDESMGSHAIRERCGETAEMHDHTRGAE